MSFYDRLISVLRSFVVQHAAKERCLILVSGFIHDVESFTNSHPGGSALIATNSGKDMTAAFFGGVYRHSSAAHNVRSPLSLYSILSIAAPLYDAHRCTRWGYGNRPR